MALLLDEYPLLILPRLACAIGLNEAIVLQQIHYWLEKSKHKHEGRKWVYNTYEEWQEQFPFWSVPTIRRALAALSKPYAPKSEGDCRLKRGPLVLIDRFNEAGFDKTNWYAIDYQELARLEGVIKRSDQDDQTVGSERSDGRDQSDPPNTRDYTETSDRDNIVVVDVPDEVAERLETLASIGVENPKREELAGREIDPLWIEAWYLWAQDPRRRSLTNPVGNIIRKLEGREEPPAGFLQEAEVQRRRRQRELEWAQEERQAAKDGPPEIQEEDAVPQEVQRMWSTILDELSMQMTRATFDTWLRGSRVVETGDGHLTVSVRHAYGVDWLQNRLITVIERTASRRAGRETEVTFMALTS